MNNLTLWAGHIEYNAAGRTAYRAEGSMDYLKMIYKESIKGWLPHAQNEPHHAWGEIRLNDGTTIIAKAYWDSSKWAWAHNK